MSVVLSNPLSMGKIAWKLRETMARRKVSNKDLANALGVHATTISRIKSRDLLPELGSEEIERYRAAISELSRDRFGPCKLSELVELDEECDP